MIINAARRKALILYKSGKDPGIPKELLKRYLRDMDIIRRFRDGETHESISKDYNLSRARVQQITKNEPIELHYVSRYKNNCPLPEAAWINLFDQHPRKSCKELAEIYKIPLKTVIYIIKNLSTEDDPYLKINPNVEDKFWALVAPPDKEGCMMWLGITHQYFGKDYGIFSDYRLKKRPYSFLGISRSQHHFAARLAWIFAKGPIPKKNLKLFKKCRNRLCCNAEHMLLVTKQELSELIKRRSDKEYKTFVESVVKYVS